MRQKMIQVLRQSRQTPVWLDEIQLSVFQRQKSYHFVASQNEFSM
jgi:hypothetical protein